MHASGPAPPKSISENSKVLVNGCSYCRRLLPAAKTIVVKKPKTKIMKHTYLVLLALAATVFVGCNQEKAAIEDNNKATKAAIDNRKDAVDAAAKDAKKQTEVNASIDKARIEANKDITQAQLDADKKKVDADAKAEKARVDAEKK